MKKLRFREGVGSYPRSHTSVAEPCFEFRFINSVHRLLSVSPASLPLRSCKYLLSLVTTLCWHSQTWVGLKATREARESEFVRTPCSFMFHPPTPGTLLTFKLCMSINKIYVYAYQYQNQKWQWFLNHTLWANIGVIRFCKIFSHALFQFTDIHRRAFLTCAYLKS